MSEENGKSNTQNKKPQTWDHLKKSKQPTTRKIRIILDADVDTEYRDAEREWNMTQLMWGQSEEPSPENQKKLSDSKTRYEQAKAAAIEQSMEFKFQSLGRKTFSALLDQHPPTTAQVENGQQDGEVPDWNTDTFPQALVHAAIVSPALTNEQVEEMWDSPVWSTAELNDLFSAALACQNTRRLLEVGNV